MVAVGWEYITIVTRSESGKLRQTSTDLNMVPARLEPADEVEANVSLV